VRRISVFFRIANAVRREVYYSSYQQVTFTILHEELVKRTIVPYELPFRVKKDNALADIFQCGSQTVQSCGRVSQREFRSGGFD